MTSSNDERNINSSSDCLNYKGRQNVSTYLNNDSGYSSDSSSASGSSFKVQHESSLSNKSPSLFRTPDVSWKSKLRYSNTPYTSSKCEIQNIETPKFTPIEGGPLLRSKSYPSTSTPCPPSSLSTPSSPSSPSSPSIAVLNLDLSLKASITPEKTTKTSLKDKPKSSPSEKKSYFYLRSPLKSPFKLIKKQKSVESLPSPEDPFSDPVLKERTVKDLFGNASSPRLPVIRRASPRLSNVFTRLMDTADYLLINVFGFLNEKDLVNVSQVCHHLRGIVRDSKALSSRKKLYLERRKSELERLGKENEQEKCVARAAGSVFFITSPRKHLQQLQNSLSSPQKSPVKPITRFERFVKEGKKLLPGETQQKCVQCQHPAHLSPSESKASCTNPSCAFICCTRCLLPFHEKPSECLALKPKPKVSTASKILSKACKRRLRRL